MTMQEEHEFLLKHFETPLYDLRLKVQIDRKKRSVLLISDGFDSWLIGGFVVNRLPEYEVHAFADSRGYENIHTRWSLTYEFAGRRFVCSVVAMRDYALKQDAITTVLWKPDDNS